MAAVPPWVSDAPIYETANYVVKVVVEPSDNTRIYGVVNKKYDVTEAYISNLARVIQVANAFESYLSDGLDDDVEGDLTEFLPIGKGN